VSRAVYIVCTKTHASQAYACDCLAVAWDIQLDGYGNKFVRLIGVVVSFWGIEYPLKLYM
jgi:hypothetical protein